MRSIFIYYIIDVHIYVRKPIAKSFRSGFKKEDLDVMALCASQGVVAFMTVRVYRLQPIVYIFNS